MTTMAFLFASKNPFDDIVDKATSELLPSGTEDMALNFEICDQIRGKQVPAKDAMRSLKRRIIHKNPNVQILALKLTDVCIKNGGQHFLVEVATSEFIDSIVEQLRSGQVRVLILQMLQSWALAFKGKPQLEYVYSVYSNLKSEGGWNFPAPPAEDKLGGKSIMIDTSAPPDWTDSAVCERCRTNFTFTNRKHHCRACGRTFCQECSSKSIPLPHFGIKQDVRVCDSCFSRGGKPMPPNQQAAAAPKKSSSAASSPVNQHSGSASSTSKEQEDLDLAIALSLAESEKQQHQQPRRQQSQQPQQHQHGSQRRESRTNKPSSQAARAASDGEEDPDLARAIAASLAEMNTHDSPFAANRREDARGSVSRGGRRDDDSASRFSVSDRASISDTNLAKQETPAKPTIGLSSVEMENIELFTQMMQRLEEQGDAAAILASRDYASLHQSMAALQPRLTAWLHETLATHRQLADLHTKVSEAIRKYESAIESRMGGMAHPFYAPQTANRPPHAGYGQQQQGPPQPHEFGYNQGGGPQQGHYGPGPGPVAVHATASSMNGPFHQGPGSVHEPRQPGDRPLSFAGPTGHDPRHSMDRPLSFPGPIGSGSPHDQRQSMDRPISFAGPMGPPPNQQGPPTDGHQSGPQPPSNYGYGPAPQGSAPYGPLTSMQASMNSPAFGSGPGSQATPPSTLATAPPPAVGLGVDPPPAVSAPQQHQQHPQPPYYAYGPPHQPQHQGSYPAPPTSGPAGAFPGVGPQYTGSPGTPGQQQQQQQQQPQAQQQQQQPQAQQQYPPGSFYPQQQQQGPPHGQQQQQAFPPGHHQQQVAPHQMHQPPPQQQQQPPLQPQIKDAPLIEL